MTRSLIVTLVALLAMGSLAVGVDGALISGTLSGDSTLSPTAPGVYVQNYTGDGDDTRLGSFTSASTSNIDFSNPPAVTISDGMLTETFAQGTLFGTTSGSGTANGLGSATFTLDFVITGGTGFFTGDTGEASIVGTIMSTGPTAESITGSYTGSLAFVPEPSTLLLFAPAAVLVAITLIFRRRRRAMGR